MDSAMAERYVVADPYPWTFNGDLRPANGNQNNAEPMCQTLSEAVCRKAKYCKN